MSCLDPSGACQSLCSEVLYTNAMPWCEWMKWMKGLTLWCHLPAAMRTAMAEFPALDDADAHAEALQLLQACAAGSMEPWTAVLALLLGDSDTLAGVSLRQMQQATASAASA